jgi:hypothetical protein
MNSLNDFLERAAAAFSSSSRTASDTSESGFLVRFSILVFKLLV